MSIRFGYTLDLAYEAFRGLAILSKLESITLIRDVYGKIRIFLEPISQDPPTDEEIEILRKSLEDKLGVYFGQDIWSSSQGKDIHRSLGNLVIDSRIPQDWGDAEVAPRWYVVERHISKKSWTAPKRASQPPWEFDHVSNGYQPGIVSFFSFKGGMGRTTSLAATALSMARRGYRIAVVDLDLEAPGLTSLFFHDTANDTGVVDYLLEKRIQGPAWKLHSSIQVVNAWELLGDEGEPIHVLPAGSVNREYLEKLARLDFQHLLDKGNNLAELLQKMLFELNAILKPLDFIFLDARAGFHDIGGLAVADLSHASVLFGNNSRQTWAGLEQVIHRLARGDEGDPQSVLLAHAMAPPIGTAGREMELQQFRERAYDTFLDYYYPYTDFEVPNFNDEDAPFRPVVLPWQEAFRGDLAMYMRDETIDERERIASQVRKMTDLSYQEVAERICRLFGKEFRKNEGDSR